MASLRVAAGPDAMLIVLLNSNSRSEPDLVHRDLEPATFEIAQVPIDLASVEE
jgi:hypothetical protein